MSIGRIQWVAFNGLHSMGCNCICAVARQTSVALSNGLHQYRFWIIMGAIESRRVVYTALHRMRQLWGAHMRIKPH